MIPDAMKHLHFRSWRATTIRITFAEILSGMGIFRQSGRRTRGLSVMRFENELLYAPVQQLAHIKFIFGRTCNLVNPPELLELFTGFPQHSQNFTVKT